MKLGKMIRRIFNRLKEENRTIYLLWILPVAFIGLFYFFPLSSIIKLSLSRSTAGILLPIIEAVKSPSIRNVLGFTFWQASVSTVATLLIGLPGAYLFARFEFKGKGIIRALMGVPFVMPTLVVAAGFNALLGPKGWLNQQLMSTFDLPGPPIAFLNTFHAIIIAHVFYNLTIVLRMVGDYWAYLDPRISQAASTLGANRWQNLRLITFPLLKPVILAAALLVFIFDFTSFGVILILGGPQFATIEVEIYYQTVSLFNLPLAAVLSLIQLTITLLLTIMYSRLSSSLSHPGGRQARKYTQSKLLNLRSRLIAGTFIVLLLVLQVSPLAALAIQSVIPLEDNNLNGEVVTLDFYRQLNSREQTSLFYVSPINAIGISVGYALTTVILALALGLPAAAALAASEESLLNRILDPLLMMPLGTSAVTLGLGFIVAFAAPPLDLRASPLLIPIAHTLVAFPFVVRSLTPALRSIKQNLRKAAAVLGASPGKVFRFIDLPMISRAVFVAATFAFTISMGEFGATALIYRPEYPTIPVVIYRFLSRPGALNYGQALALSTILMVITLSGMLAIERFRIADIGEF